MFFLTIDWRHKWIQLLKSEQFLCQDTYRIESSVGFQLKHRTIRADISKNGPAT